MSRMRVTPAMAAAAKATAMTKLAFSGYDSNVRPTVRPRQRNTETLLCGLKLNINSGIKKRMRAARRS